MIIVIKSFIPLLLLIFSDQLSAHPPPITYSCSIIEESPIGTQVCDLRPIILLRGFSASSQVTLLNELHTFALIGDKLTTRGRVDRERFIAEKKCQQERTFNSNDAGQYMDSEDQFFRIHCILSLELAVTSDTPQGQPSFIHIPVLVQDVNDHTPRFDQQNTGLWFEVFEDLAVDMDPMPGSVITHQATEMFMSPVQAVNREIASLPIAIDPDYAENGTISYDLVGPDAAYFKLVSETASEQLPLTSPSPNPVQGHIRHLRLICTIRLDYEDRMEYKMYMMAKDQCSNSQLQRSTQLPITISVKGVNEYNPVFSMDQIEQGVSKNPYSTIELPIRVKLGEDSRILFIDIPENTPLGSNIYQFIARDRDKVPETRQPSSQSNTIVYTMGSGANLKVRRYFRLGRDNGKLTLVHLLDYENGPRYFDLIVLAIDSSKPSRTGSLSVSVRVLDVNDEAPSIQVQGIRTTRPSLGNDVSRLGMYGQMATHSHTLTVKENSPAGTFVARVSVRDRDQDSAGDVTCSLEKFFPEFIPVKHRVSEVPFRLQSVTKSDNPSKFNFDHSPALSTDQQRLKYYMILTNVELDREQQQDYSLVINCHDNSPHFELSTNYKHSVKQHTSSVLIRIMVEDENDNGPVFQASNYEAEILENTLPESRIIQLKAIDPDITGESTTTRFRFATQDELRQTGDNRTVSLNEVNGHFNLEERSGWLLTGRVKLDREVKSEFHLPVVAFDVEFPNKSSFAWVHVTVLDENDHPPNLVGNSTFWIDEESSVTNDLVLSKPPNNQRQVFIGHLRTEDADLGENAKVTYHIVDAEREDPFFHEGLKWQVQSDGSLVALIESNTTLDREQQRFYLLTLILSDQSVHSPLSTTVTITVRLRDLNDNIPQFIQPSLADSPTPSGSLKSIRVPSTTVQIFEATSPGTLLFTAQATDADDGENGRVVYSIEPYEGLWQILHTQKNQTRTNDDSSNPYIIIDSQSGEIRLNQRLSPSDTKVPRKMVIFADDCGTPPLRNFAFLILEIIDPHQKFRTSLNRTLSPLKTRDSDAIKTEKFRVGHLDPHSRTYVTSESIDEFEWMTGLGVGLVFVLLICLLLLVTYALYGTRRRKRRCPAEKRQLSSDDKIRETDRGDRSSPRKSMGLKGCFGCFLHESSTKKSSHKSPKGLVKRQTNDNITVCEFPESIQGSQSYTTTTFANLSRETKQPLYEDNLPLAFITPNNQLDDRLRTSSRAYTVLQSATLPSVNCDQWFCTNTKSLHEFDRSSPNCAMCSERLSDESPAQSVYTPLIDGARFPNQQHVPKTLMGNNVGHYQTMIGNVPRSMQSSQPVPTEYKITENENDQMTLLHSVPHELPQRVAVCEKIEFAKSDAQPPSENNHSYV